MLNTTKKITAVFTAPRMSVAMAAMLLGTICLLPEGGNAQVTGACVNCHTMHNSQGGASMNPGGTDTVYQSLTKGDCLGCHTGGAGDVTDSNIPKVNHTGTPTVTTLAGGSFFWAQTDSTKGHNVVGVGTQNMMIPPGFDSATAQGYNTSNGLTCAGTNGCHGNRGEANEFKSLSGAHHAPKLTGNIATGADLKTSYRFLNTIKGIEDPLWESTTGGNQYYGTARATQVVEDTQTISALCGQCHGAFHATASNYTTDATKGISASSTGAMASPWVRHPTDFDMSLSGEYAGYNAYRKDVPVASSINTTQATLGTTAGTRIVTCISCHRAHGSNEPDLLRFTYNMNAHNGTSTAGCFACHTTKDDA